MTLLAGVYALRATSPDADGFAAMQAALGRSGDTVHTAGSGRAALAKIDIGAFEAPAFLDDNSGPVMVVTGRPLFDAAGRKPHRPRDKDASALREALAVSGHEALRRCQGSYTLAAWDAGKDELLLAADKLGSRPLYFAFVGDMLYFASAMRVLEAVPALEPVVDMRALTEEILLGFPLADRTAVEQIRVLRGGEVLTARGDAWQRQHYAHWSEAAATSAPDRAELVARYNETFLDAVACRAPASGGVNAFLSGGLDARVIAGSLIAAGRQVRSLTFEFPNRLDGPLARKLAEALGTDHSPVTADPGVGQLQHKLTAARALGADLAAGGSASIFSGDGGSVGLGYVYMDAQLVDALRAGRRDAALAQHLEGKALPRKALRADAFQRMAPMLREGIEAELAAAGSDDPARSFHTYLMDNDQRRHLYAVFEQLDIGRTEFELPFFDGRLLEMTAAAPVEWFLRHDFYYEWLKLLPAPVYDTPWQAYPGHLPCPHSLDEFASVRSQWDQTSADRFKASAPLYRRCRANAFGEFPGEILSRPAVLVALAMHGLRLRDYAYLWKVIDTIQQTSARCGGRVAWS